MQVGKWTINYCSDTVLSVEVAFNDLIYDKLLMESVTLMIIL